jgi:hypothetical protein
VRAPWLGDVLTDAGLTVIRVGDPVGRGRDMATIYGVVGHDTVTPATWADSQTDRLIRDGHGSLPGPLYQLGLDRQGRFRWIADGRSNHNGPGTWGNDAIGIGVYCNGAGTPKEPWNGAQREAFIAGTRAILAHLQLGRSMHWNPRVAGHKETDPGRKQDPYGVNMADVRRAVAAPPQETDTMTPDQEKRLLDAIAAIPDRTWTRRDPHYDNLNESFKLRQAVRTLSAVAPQVARLASTDPATLTDGQVDELAHAIADGLDERVARRTVELIGERFR